MTWVKSGKSQCQKWPYLPALAFSLFVSICPLVHVVVFNVSRHYTIKALTFRFELFDTDYLISSKRHILLTFLLLTTSAPPNR